MNLFRSEEHAKNWTGYSETMAAALMPVAAWADIFANPFFKERGRADYLSWLQSDAAATAYGQLRNDLPQPSEAQPSDSSPGESA